MKERKEGREERMKERRKEKERSEEGKRRKEGKKEERKSKKERKSVHASVFFLPEFLEMFQEKLVYMIRDPFLHLAGLNLAHHATHGNTDQLGRLQCGHSRLAQRTSLFQGAGGTQCCLGAGLQAVVEESCPSETH